jgi:centrosomal protein CEP41
MIFLKTTFINLSVIRGIGEQDMRQASNTNRSSNINTAITNDVPYLLLDIRDKDEYDNCHIKTALNYPIAMLSRSINNETKELLAFKNQEGKIILIYDDDEKIGPKAAATFVERGYDNLFMLSGG